MELISVIVPVYNVAEYLPRCIESILNQTYQEMEIILINDGSTDDSGAICDEYGEKVQKNKRIRVIHQENAGVSAARNAGLDAAQGEWIGFVDPDDQIEPEMFEKLYKATIKSKKNIAVCGFIKHCTGGWLDNRSCPEIPAIVSTETALRYILHNRYFEGAVWNKLFSLKHLNNAGIRFNPKFYACQDIVFTAKAFLQMGEAVYVPEALYHYYMREGSITQSFNPKRISGLNAWEETISLLSPISKKLEGQAKVRYTATAIEQIRSAVQFDGTAYLPLLQRRALRYVRSFFLSLEIDFRMKLRGAAVIIFPKASYRVWQWLRNRFNITWWHKELRDGRV